MAKKVQRGLGRGLGALLGDVVEEQQVSAPVQEAAEPQKVVDEEKAKGEMYKEMLEKVLENIKNMENM